jgi:hypothetical protein
MRTCHIINQYDRKLTLKNWADITDAISKADFWGLKKENGVYGFDGDNIYVTGYIKGDGSFSGPAKFNYIHRWVTFATGIGEPFKLILKLSGNKQGCLIKE